MIDVVPLREARHKLLVDARATVDKTDGEKRAFTAEERTEYDRLWKEAEAKRVEIDDAERRNELERAELAQQFKREEEEERRKKAGQRQIATTRRSFDTDEYRTAWSKMLRYDSMTEAESRALAAGAGTSGGYLYAPEVFVNELIQNITDATPFRGLARVWPPIIGADSLGAPVLTNRMAAAAWTSELGTPSTDSTLAFGKRAITPHPLAKEILVSKVLLRKVPSAEQIVRSELARVVSEAMENAYMTGSGDQQPLGIFTASDVGVSTGRDVSTGNAATSVTFDGLKTAKYTLKQAYWNNARWIAHRDFMAQVAKLKDGNGRYLLQDSVVQGEGDRILGFPIVLSEFASNTFTTGKYVAVLADFRQLYWIVDSQDVQILRLEEYYARQNQDDFIIRMDTDGAPVLEEACVRVKLG